MFRFCLPGAFINSERVHVKFAEAFIIHTREIYAVARNKRKNYVYISTNKIMVA